MTPPRELLKAADIEAMEGQSKAHLLNPNAVRVAKSLGAATGLTQLGFHLMTVMPGQESTEYHRHLYEEQCFYILSGRGEVVIDEQRHALEPGDFAGFPRRGAAHTMVNTGDQPLVFLTARTLLEQDVCDYPRQQKRLYMTGSEEAVVEFSAIMR